MVVDADTGERGRLLTPQPGHPAFGVGRQAGLFRRDLRPARGQELGDVVAAVHALQRRPLGNGEGCPVSTPFAPGPIGHEFVGVVEDVGAEGTNV